MDKMEKSRKKAFCIDCKKETPLEINKVRQMKDEILYIGQCGLCLSKIVLVESADIIKP